MRFAVLVTHKGPLTKGTLKELQVEAPQLGLPVKILYADTLDEIDVALAELAEKPGAALMVSPDALFTNLRAQIVALAAQHVVPAIYSVRDFAEAGGLISYGPNFMSTYQQVGEYSGSNTPRRETFRSAGRASNQVRAGNQPQGRKGARPRCAGHTARARRRCDRVNCHFAQCPLLHLLRFPIGPTLPNRNVRFASHLALPPSGTKAHAQQAPSLLTMQAIPG